MLPAEHCRTLAHQLLALLRRDKRRDHFLGRRLSDQRQLIVEGRMHIPRQPACHAGLQHLKGTGAAGNVTAEDQTKVGLMAELRRQPAVSHRIRRDNYRIRSLVVGCCDAQ